MGIVRFALRFPHTFYVLAAMILFLGVCRDPVDADGYLSGNPHSVVTVIWQYTGLTTPEMEQRVSTYSQYSISANVNGIKNMEAQTLNGLSIQKLYFQPDVNLDLAIAQVVSATNSIRALMPPGIQPPIVVQFNASSVPVLQLSLSSDSLNEQHSMTLAFTKSGSNWHRFPRHPADAGRGKYRQIMVDIDPEKAAVPGTDATRHRQCGQYPEPDAAVGHGEDGQHPSIRCEPTRRRRRIADLNQMPVKFANGAPSC